MASLSHAIIIYISLSLFFLTKSQPSIYTCEPGSNCVVDCKFIQGFQCNSGGNGSIIDALQANELTVYCYDPNACADMLIECPITSHTESKCIINCDLGNSCNSLEIHTHNTTNVTLACGDNDADRNVATDTQCKNITIDGNYMDKNERPPAKQNITIICNDEGNAPVDTPTCDIIMTKNIAQMEGAAPISDVTLNVLCTLDWAGEENTQICNRMYINAGKSKYVNLFIEGDMTNSHFNLTDLALLEVQIDILSWGTLWNTTINAPEVQNRFHINASSIIALLNSHIIGPYVDYQTACELETHYPSRFEASTFEGRFFIHGDGYYVNSIFNAKTAGYVDITVDEDGVWEGNQLIIEDSNATLRFSGKTSGYVDAKHSAILSVFCKSYYPQYSCDGLVLDIPPYVMVENIKKQKAFLECIDYGCTNITTISQNGADDIAVTAISCDCSEFGKNGESGNSCIGLINLGCGDTEKAAFDGQTCHGSEVCCGDIKSETSGGLCNRVHESSGMSDWEVVGVFVGVLFGLLLIGSLWCYCSTQRTIRDHIKTTQDTNPYTQTIVEEEEQKGNGILAGSGGGGYGTVTAPDAI